MAESVDYARLYDEHPSYSARRMAASFERAQVACEVHLFKLPAMLALWPGGPPASSVLEIGCATGELIGAWPIAPGGRRLGLDLSPRNIEAARARFPDVEFDCVDFHAMSERFDAVVLSDVLEHVEDDVAMLHDAARLGCYVLVNLPLEDNWLNAWRRYGPADVSGHLRRYSLAQGLRLFERAGLRVLGHRRLWIHETAAEPERRRLRQQYRGRAFGGGAMGSRLRRLLFSAVAARPALARRVFASNLFAIAEPAGRRAATP